MDSGACSNQQDQCQDWPRNSSENLDEVRNEGVVAIADNYGAVSLEPITPVLKRGVVDVPLDYDSPIAEYKRPARVSCFALETIRKEDQDEEIFKSMYNDILEAVVLNQTEGHFAEISNIEWDSESFKTPPGPHLNGISKTCPGAPMKPPAKSWKVDLGLRRKLEFSEVSAVLRFDADIMTKDP